MKVRNLSLEISGKPLLHELSFEIPEASIFLLLGPNGAGKTLLLRCLAKLCEPTRGSVESGNQAIAWVPLSQPLPFSYSVDELLLMGRYALHQGFPQAEDRRRTKDAATKLGISDLLHRSYNSLSRGEQTKTDIARALGSEAKVWLLDEPFSNLDIDASLQMIELFQSLRAEGYTIILSHHDLYSARSLASHGLLIKKGRLLKSGPMEDLFAPGPLREAYNVEAVFSPDSFVRFEKI